MGVVKMKGEKERFQRDITKYVDELMKKERVPGIALGVLKKGEVYLCKGFGFRDLEKKLPVTSRTLFQIGSTTKGFSTLALSALADQGEISWDSRLKSVFPWVAMVDRAAEERLTLRDMACHRSGLPRQNSLGMATLTRAKRQSKSWLISIHPPIFGQCGNTKTSCTWHWVM
jgi:CubicO group peptidase (beta-lactamase class C family)